MNTSRITGSTDTLPKAAAQPQNSRTPSKSAFDPLKKSSPTQGTNNSAVTTSTSSTSNMSPLTPAAATPLSDSKLLAKALAELDRERTKRAEAETRASTLAFDQRRLRSDLIIIRSQRDAFVDMVESMTTPNCDAVAYAASRPENQSLPLHDIRLLEVMPWDTERVRNIAEKVDEVYEWQVYDADSDRWTNRRDMFPNDFQELPVYRPRIRRGSDGDDGTEQQHERGGRSGFSKGVVLTDANCTRILNLEQGYPLPSVGSTWKWIGGWRVELQHPCGTPCDEKGWTYAKLPKLLVSRASNAVFGSAAPASAAEPLRRFRRRRWTRLRVLVSYPSISERTESCLFMLAENAVLEMNANKLENELLRMSNALKDTIEANKNLNHRLHSTEAALRVLEQEKRDAAIDVVVDTTASTMSITPTTEASSIGTITPILTSKTKWRNSLSPSQVTYTTEASTSEDDDEDVVSITSTARSNSDGCKSEGGISMHPMGAKEIAVDACKKQQMQQHAVQHAAPTDLRGAVMDGARKSLDGGSALLGRIVSNIPLRSKVPDELKDSLSKIQIEDEGGSGTSPAGSPTCSDDYDDMGDGEQEPFRISSSRCPTVSY